MAKSEDVEDHVLKLTAWDYDGPHRSPDFLGQVRLPLAELINSQPDIKASDKNWWVLECLRAAWLLLGSCLGDLHSMRAIIQLFGVLARLGVRLRYLAGD